MIPGVDNEQFSIKKFLIPGKKVFKAAGPDELEINETKLVKIRGKEILLCRTEEGYFAVSDKCTYKGSSLSRGVMINGTVLCIKCGSQFDVKTGRIKTGPAKKTIDTYQVIVREDGIFIKP